MSSSVELKGVVDGGKDGLLDRELFLHHPFVESRPGTGRTGWNRGPSDTIYFSSFTRSLTQSPNFDLSVKLLFLVGFLYGTRVL